ncbi:TPA: hypothetical protein ACHVJ4_004346 [Bacillus cereus]
MPNDGQSNNNQWENIIKAGVYAIAKAYGEEEAGPIGAKLAEMIVASIFHENEENKFEDAIKDLKESIKQEIDSAFLKNDSGAIIGLGTNFSTYLITRDKEALDLIHNDITQKIDSILTHRSEEALVIAVYAVNIYVLVLRALADHKENYYQAVKKNVKLYADKIEKLANEIEEKFNTSLPEHCSFSTVQVPQATICDNKPGFTYSIQARYFDEYGIVSKWNMFESKECKPFPFYSLEGRNFSIQSSNDFYMWKSVFRREDYEANTAVIQCEETLKNVKQARKDSLNQFMRPTHDAISCWNDIVNSIPG